MEVCDSIVRWKSQHFLAMREPWTPKFNSSGRLGFQLNIRWNVVPRCNAILKGLTTHSEMIFATLLKACHLEQGLRSGHAGGRFWFFAFQQLRRFAGSYAVLYCFRFHVGIILLSTFQDPASLIDIFLFTNVFSCFIEPFVLDLDFEHETIAIHFIHNASRLITIGKLRGHSQFWSPNADCGCCNAGHLAI